MPIKIARFRDCVLERRQPNNQETLICHTRFMIGSIMGLIMSIIQFLINFLTSSVET